MSHFNLISIDDVLQGPAESPSVVGGSAIFVCSNTVRDHIERRKPVTKKFTSHFGRDSFWIKKFEAHTKWHCDTVTFAKGNSGKWYVEAINI